MNFKIIVSEPTHLKGGHIDQAWLRDDRNAYDVQLYSPYYTCKDHDALLVTLYDSQKPQGIFSLIIQCY